MAEIGFENGRNSNFQGLVTLTLDPAIWHTVVHHSSTSTYIPNFIEIEETFCGWTDGRTFFPPLILLGRLLEVDLKINVFLIQNFYCAVTKFYFRQYRTFSQVSQDGQRLQERYPFICHSQALLCRVLVRQDIIAR